MIRKNNYNYSTLFFLSLIVYAVWIIACVPVQQPSENIQQHAEEKAVTATLCTNVFDEYSSGKIEADELLFLYKPSSVAFKKSNGIYMREQDKELCLYLKLNDLDLDKKYVLQYKIYNPDNELHSKENYNFIPDSLPYHAWNTKKIYPENRKPLQSGAWAIKVTLNGRPVVNKVFAIHSKNDSNDVVKEQFQKRKETELAWSIFTDKVRKNGALLFCNNDCYRECYKINRATCLDELNPLTDACIERATDNSEQSDLSNEIQPSFGDLWALCMQVEHALMHTGNPDNAPDCVAECPGGDEEQLLRDLLQN